MMDTLYENPFHTGERMAQDRAGVGDVSAWAGGFIRDSLPRQHRDFHTALPFLVLSGADDGGQVWTTLIDGEEGFIRSPDPVHLTLHTAIQPTDPLAKRFRDGGDIGGLGIDLATRRRNRFSGHIRGGRDGLTIGMRQTFGNCPQYIRPRAWDRAPRAMQPTASRTDHLSDAQIACIRGADTLFIGSGHRGENGAASNGFDASHRGGSPGFVRVDGPTRLCIPDYAGNNFFNTIGNILSDPRVGLVFVDFASGGLLHVSGRARIDWSPVDAHDPEARRMIEIDILSVIDRPGALSLRWQRLDSQGRTLRLIRRIREADNITSFHFAPIDGRPLDPFRPGQHLPVAIQIPGQNGVSERSYSLSGAASDRTTYRLGIKREPHGLVSRFAHDNLREGDTIEVRPPSGDFVIPEGTGPVILVGAGVGLTPMVSMLHALAGTARPVRYVHSTRNGRNHALRGEVDRLIAQNENLRQHIVYTRPDDDDRAAQAYDATGRISAADLVALGGGGDARYLLCGPGGFLADLRRGLEQLDIPADHIHFEIFGPAGRG